MKKHILIIISILLSAPVFSQDTFFDDHLFKLTKILHVGTNYTPNANGIELQFYASSSYPWLQHKGLVLSSEVSYLGKRKGADLTGFKFQPLNAHYILWSGEASRITLGSDFSYLANSRKEFNNGFVITPNIKYELAGVDVKAGYDFDVTNGLKQFNVSVSMSVSAIGMLIYGLSKYNN